MFVCFARTFGPRLIIIIILILLIIFVPHIQLALCIVLKWVFAITTIYLIELN